MFLLNLDPDTKYGHVTWPKMQISKISFCPNSTFNIMKRHKISSGKAVYFTSYQQKTSWEKHLPPPPVSLGLTYCETFTDAVHVGKERGRVFSNWFLFVDGEKINLVLLRVLRNDTLCRDEICPYQSQPNIDRTSSPWLTLVPWNQVDFDKISEKTYTSTCTWKFR